MIDKIFLTKDVTSQQTKLTNFIEKTNKRTGEIYYETHFNNMNVRCNNDKISILGSLNKSIKGNNYENVSYNECLEQLDVLSDGIGVNLNEFRIMQLEIGTNYKICQNPKFYIDNLIDLSRHNTGVYYSKGVATGKTFETRSNKFIVYDKIKELKAQKEIIKNDFKDINLIRIENKYNKQMKKTFKFIPYAKDLKTESFKEKLLKDYLNKFQNIGKKMNIEIPKNIRTKGDFRKALLLVNTERTEELIKGIELMVSNGEINSTEASKIRNFLTKDRKKLSNYFELQDTLNDELNEKVTKRIENELNE